ncbi:hypothetical protein D3C71_1648310 [compost metagenome]
MVHHFPKEAITEDPVVLGEKYEVMPHLVDDLRRLVDFNQDGFLLADFRNIEKFLHLGKYVPGLVFVHVPLIPELLDHAIVLIFIQRRRINRGGWLCRSLVYRVHGLFSLAWNER